MSEKLHSETIRHALQINAPSMIARFGSVEIKGVLYPRMPWLIRRAVRDTVFSAMGTNAGFFPVTDVSIEAFSERMIEDMHLLDVLASWRIEEKLLLKHLRDAKRVDLRSLEPYLSNSPWSEALEGMRVLVIHPFNNTIERQYMEKRTLLFKDRRVLPEFRSFETIKAVQTIAGQKSHFDDWFAALNFMKAAIDTKDYDVAIIGCGAYGFSLAAHVKRSGKKAVHLGGATQILFGIIGRRWETHPLIAPLFNKHWVRPAPEDVPLGAEKVENGCYW